MLNLERAMLRNILLYLLPLLLGIIVNACASQGYPEGGPKDEIPPRMVRSTPAADSKNFEGGEINIEFDELIQLKDVLQKVVVSPPVEKMPTIVGRSKIVNIKFEEDLQPATTYTIDFADAIQDNNENNPISNFTFSFSTGESMDSLEIAGHLYEAETLTPVEGALVMAHVNHADTAFTNTLPTRVAKTDEFGRFTIKNLANEVYRVFALEDANRNYRFDQPGERIAWSSELIKPSYEYREKVDSVFTDSLTLDTVLVSTVLAYLPDSLQLFFFQEDYKSQYLTSRERKVRHRLDFIFNRRLERPLEISMLNVTPSMEQWSIYEHSASNDTVSVWLADSALISRDTLTVRLNYPVRDSLDHLVDQIDTLKLFHFEQATKKKRRKDDEEETVAPLRVVGPDKILNIGARLWIEFPVPLASMDSSALTLSQLVDTLYQPVDFKWQQDSIKIRSYQVLHDWMPGEKYRLEVDSAAFEGLYGLVNKPLKYDIEVKPEDSYGTLYINTLQVDSTWLLQVLNKQEVLQRQGFLPANGKIAFRYLKPGDYWLRIVQDVNRNKKWDTGDFREGLQPEKVFYYPDVISVRPNWDQVVPWDLEAHPNYEFIEKNRVKKSKDKNRTVRKK